MLLLLLPLLLLRKAFTAGCWLLVCGTGEVLQASNVTAFDWRDRNAVTWVKDQGQCGIVHHRPAVLPWPMVSHNGPVDSSWQAHAGHSCGEDPGERVVHCRLPAGAPIALTGGRLRF